MAESAKEASRVSNQLTEILKFVSEHKNTMHTVICMSRGVDVLAARSQGMFYVIPKLKGRLSPLLVTNIEKRETEILS